ncbi:MAG TPA: glycoside hydrolase family 3 C-terminal domain-containing protein [Phycisphaerae bacterium]|nr:glycoside hydrolase family 3 C-terminal domain-containing protein [Phycisphaerae bacterium]
MQIVRRSAVALLMTGLCVTSGYAADEAYKNASLPLEERVSDLLARLTLDEKISLVHADSKFTTAALPRFGVTRRWMSDGPQGVREDVGPDTWEPAGHTDDFSTAMPANLGLSATFDPELARAYGNVIGEEASARGKQIMLGPGVNIMRTPLNGRNSEYLGEDPYLAGRMAVAYINGAQSHGIASCVKHFAANNQETERNTIDVEMDDRALHEIYLPAFKAAVTEGHAWCVMTAYNKLRGTYCSENALLLNGILKRDWGFQGLVMSDWSGTHSTVNAANHGLDLEMGTDKAYNEFYFADALRDAVQKHEVSPERLDDMARRNLRVMFATGMFDGSEAKKSNVPLLSPEHLATARSVEEAAMVLLKNDSQTLPLDAAKIKRIAVIGDIAKRKFAHGGNSAAIKTRNEVTPLEGIQKYVGERVEVVYAQGYLPSTERRKAGAGESSPELIDAAVSAAKGADAVIVLAGLYRSQDEEGVDRPDMNMPRGQAEVIERVAAVNPRTTVVLTGGGPLAIDSWLPQVPAVIQYWYGGTEGGNALADVLFGKVDPSGKLPCTFPRKLADSPAHAGADASHYPGEHGRETYAEGIFVGYRWFDAKKIEPLFPFGYGLSYTTFSCSALRVMAGENGTATVQVTVANTGKRDGAEVVQVYVRDEHSSLPRPVRELKGFQKVQLRPGEQQTVSIPLGASSFSYYDPGRTAWVAEAGEFGIDVGTSSRDLPLHGVMKIAETIVTKDGR